MNSKSLFFNRLECQAISSAWLTAILRLSILASFIFFFEANQGISQNANYSTSGSGANQEEIIWLTWDHTDQGNYEASGLQNGSGGGSFNSSTNTYGGYITNGSTMVYNLPNGAVLNVTFSNILFTPHNNPLPAWNNKTRGYQPGNMMTTAGNGSSGDVWPGGALQYGYFIGGKEILFSNIGPGPSSEPGEDAQEIRFDVTFQLLINGTPMPVDIIFSDPETTNPSSGYDESIHATTNSGVWTLVENVGSTNYVATGINSSTVIIHDTEQSGTPRGVPLLLNKGTGNSTTITYLYDYAQQAGGHQGFIIGLLYPQDHGDAPASYGDASHYQDHGAGPGTSLTNQESYYLGSRADVETSSQYSWNASGDGSDEDGISLLGAIGSGCSPTITVNASKANGRLSGWIDFDKNGVFDNYEQILNNRGIWSTNSSVTFPVPSFTGTGTTLARFRYCSEVDGCNFSTGVAADGEVEDYQVSLSGTDCTTTFSGEVCHAIKDQNCGALFSWSPTSSANNWVGSPCGTYMETMAYSGDCNTGYTIDGGSFGTLDLGNGNFTNSSSLGVMTNPTLGNENISDVDGMAIDNNTGYIYAIERKVPGNDLLFLIDPTTGTFVQNAFGPGTDYVEIIGPNIDIDDIAFDPCTGKLYGVSTESGNTSVTFNNSCQLFGSVGYNSCLIPGAIYEINLGTGAMNHITTIGGDVEALICCVTAPVPSVLSCSITIDNEIECNGDADGEITVSGTGGTGSYSYNWSGGNGTSANLNNLSGGTYTVVVTDLSGNTSSCSVVLNEPAPYSCSITINNQPSCSGISDGAATVSATGGTSPYNYAWPAGQSTPSPMMQLR